jgi:hypothetical protein
VVKLVLFRQQLLLNASAPADLLEVRAPALIADPLAAAEHGSESQVVAEGLAASDQVDLAQVDSDQADLDEAGLDEAGLEEAGSDGAGSDQVDLDVSVWDNQAAQAGLVPAWVVAPVADPACRAGMVGLVADCHRDEFPVGNPADCLVRKADECTRGGHWEDEGDDNFADDSANRPDSPDG